MHCRIYRHKARRSAAIAVALLLAATVPCLAIELVSWTIDGGGGTSQGSGLVLSGAIGQAEAGGPLTGGSLELNDGMCAWVGLWPGDINADLFVDVLDLLYLAGSWATAQGGPGYQVACDLDRNGSTNIIDLLILADNWHQ